METTKKIKLDDIDRMISMNGSAPSAAEQFALLTAFHQDSVALEEARMKLLQTLPANHAETYRLKLTLLQQMIGRCLEEEPARVPELMREESALMTEAANNGFHNNMLNSRSRLLRASVDRNVRGEFLKELVAWYPGASDVRTTVSGNSPQDLNVSKGLCPNGHVLQMFSTPTSKFSCDRCQTRFPLAAVMFGCRQCDFDLCASCFAGNSQYEAVRPSLDFGDIVSTIILSSQNQGGLLNTLTPNARGLLIATVAHALYNRDSVPQHLHKLASVCAEVFNGEKLESRQALRTLLSRDTDEKAIYAIACCSMDSLLNLILQDAAAGGTQEDQRVGIRPYNLRESIFFHYLTLEHLQWLTRKVDLSTDGFEFLPKEILRRLLPSTDEYQKSQGTFEDVVPWSARLDLLKRLQKAASEFAIGEAKCMLEYVLLYHELKLDRERRRPLLPMSATLGTKTESEMNLALFQRFLSQNRSHSSNSMHLVVAIEDYFPTPSGFAVDNLIQAELLDLFMWKAAIPSTFTRSGVAEHVVQRIYQVATIAALPPPGSEPSIQFCDFNAKYHLSNAPVELFCDFENVKGDVSVKVFHVDAKQLYRKTKSNINTAIVLDGLVAHEEQILPFKPFGRFGREVIRLFDGKPCAGCFVVEVMSGGTAARAVIRKGAINCIERSEPYGHVFFAFDAEAKPRKPLDATKQKVELWVEGKVYTPEPVKDGEPPETRIVVPFHDASTPSSSAIAVLTCTDEIGSRSYLFKFTRKSANLELRANFFVDREALISGNRSAQVLVRPSLMLAGVPAPLGLLNEIELSLSFVNAEGTQSEQKFILTKEDLKGDVSRTFQVTPNLEMLTCSLRAKEARTGMDVQCVDAFTIGGLNDQCKTPIVKGLFIHPLPDGFFELLVLGRTGEPYVGETVTIMFQHEACIQPVSWTRQTDNKGSIPLGSLDSIAVVHCSTKGEGAIQTRFVVPKNGASLGTIQNNFRALETDHAQLVYPLKQKLSQLSRNSFGLFKVSAKNMFVQDCFRNLSLSPNGTHLYARGLARGTYQLYIFEMASTQTIHISVSAGATAVQNGALRLPDVSGRVYVSDPAELSHTVAIDSVEARPDGNVSVIVAGGSTTKRRVHALIRTFLRRDGVPTSLDLMRCLSPKAEVSLPDSMLVTIPRALYVKQRKVGDEILYCTSRDGLQKMSGNMLPPPSQLVFDEDKGETHTAVFEPRMGTFIAAEADDVGMVASFKMREMAPGPEESGASLFGSVAQANYLSRSAPSSRIMARASFAPPAMAPAPHIPKPGSALQEYLRGGQSYDLDNCIDFLPSPSYVLENLIPNPQTGRVDIQLDPALAGSWMEIVATDDDGSVASKNIVLPILRRNQLHLDMRHRAKVALDSHVVEAQGVHFLHVGQKFEVGSVATAKVGLLDTLASFFDFAKAMVPADTAPSLNEYSFLKNWDQLSMDAKIKLVDKKSCYELALFLKLRDAEFFNQVIRPQLEERPFCARNFMDVYLLDGDLTQFASPEIARGLFRFEQCLLAIGLRDSHPILAQQILGWLQNVVELNKKVIEQRKSHSFRVAISVCNVGSAVADAMEVPEPESTSAGFAALQAQADYDEMTVAPWGGSTGGRAMKQMATKAARKSAPSHRFQQEQAEDISPESSDHSDEEEQEEDEASMVSSNDEGEQDAMLVERIHKAATRDKYKETGPAHAWVERYLSMDPSNYADAPENVSFWYAFLLFHLERRQGAFLHQDLCLSQTTRLTEALVMLSVLNAPYRLEQSHRFDARRDVGELDIHGASPCLIFHEQMAPANASSINDNAGSSSKVLVGQLLFDLRDMVVGKSDNNGEENEPLEIIAGNPYIARVSVTNVSSSPLRVKVFIQTPEGALPLCSITRSSDKASKIEEKVISPFTTAQCFSAAFYFPVSGQFGWFPTHVSKSAFGTSELLTYASPRYIQVVQSQTMIDETSWTHLCSRSATIDQVCAFLERTPITSDLTKSQTTANNQIKLVDICWRFLQAPLETVGKSDWMRVMDVLERRGIVSPEVGIFALIHDEDGGIKRGGPALFGIAAGGWKKQFGYYFNSPYLKYDSLSILLPTFERLELLRSLPEVYPLVNARAHPLASAQQKEVPSPNDMVSRVHRQFLENLQYWDKPLTWDQRVKLVILLLEEGKITAAKEVFKAGSPPSKTAQNEYLAIYLAFYVDNPRVDAKAIALECLQRASPFVTHPNTKWRERFIRVVRTCKSILGEAVFDDALAKANTEEANHSEMAARAPSFEAEVSENKRDLIILTQNVESGSEFTINMFKMNVEHLFSTKPFSLSQDSKSLDLGQFASVLPNFRMTATAQNDNRIVIPIPTQFVNDSVLIQVAFEAQQRLVTKFASSMRINFVEDFGILKATKRKSDLLEEEPVIMAYCKVYAKKKDGGIIFFKDGYTDIRGEFDYCGLNTTRTQEIVEFAVFVSHPEFGSSIRKVAPPSI